LGFGTTIWMRQLPGFWWSLLSALLAIATGAALLWWPFGGVLSLTLGLAIFFLIEGAVSIMYALDHRREFGGRWGWMLASGVVDTRFFPGATVIRQGCRVSERIMLNLSVSLLVRPIQSDLTSSACPTPRLAYSGENAGLRPFTIISVNGLLIRLISRRRGRED